VLNNSDRNMENNSVNRDTANNFANLNTENIFISNPTAENNNFVSQSAVSLSQNPIYCHADKTASDMYSNHVNVNDDVYMPTGHGTQQVHVPSLPLSIHRGSRHLLFTVIMYQGVV